MATIEELAVKAILLRNRIDKSIENGKKTAIAKRTQGFYETKSADLKSLWTEFCAVDEEINIAVHKKPDEKLPAHIADDVFGQVELKYFEYMGELADALIQLAPQPNNNSTFNGTSNGTVAPVSTTIIQQQSPLSKIPLPTFNGDYDRWRSFHDLFVSLVHNSPRLTPVQKLHHLKSCLIGDAEKVLRHTPITDSDYEPAWSKLKGRYENKKILVNHQLKALFNQAKLNNESSKGIKSLIDTTEECLQQLNSLQVDTSSWDTILIYLLVQKLPYNTLRLWEEEQGSKRELPTLNQFKTFLNTRLQVLESIADATANKHTHSNPIKEKTLSYHISKEGRCPACHERHFLAKYPKYLKMNVQARLKLIQSARLCLNCFNRSHSYVDCHSKYRCFKCKQRHHTSLHEDNNMGQSTSNFTRNKSNTMNDNSTRGQAHSSNQNHLITQAHSSSQNPLITQAHSSNQIPPNQAHSSSQNPLITQAHSSNQSSFNHAHSSNQTPLIPAHSSSQNSAYRADGSSSTQTFVTNENFNALLSTALVVAQAEQGEPIILRCLIDPGSQSSFITEAACQRLGADCKPTSIAITGLSTSPAAVSRKQTSLLLRSCGPETTVVQEHFLVLKKITDPLPRSMVPKKDCRHLAGLQLADSTFWKPGRIDALLGARIYAKIVQEGIRRGSNTAPVAINTIFGWILLGPTNSIGNTASFTATTADIELNTQIKRFWEIEEVPTKPILTKEEQECQHLFHVTHERLESGQYQVKLPFRNNEVPQLGQSRPQALRRFLSLQRQFEKNSQLETDYTQCLNEYIELGHMEETDPPKDNELNYYIPHHAVFKESSTTKLRVVFDASCKSTNGNSLNDCLLNGPTLQPKLFATLLNWRKYKIAMNADIEKMYRMIKVHPEHQTFQRILWKHPITKEVKDYKLNTVTFGTSSAPYLAIRTLKQLAEDEKDRWPLASKITHNSFYVDDLLAGADSSQDAKKLQVELIAMMRSGGFNLRKWASNDVALLKDIPLEHRELKSPLTFSEDDSVKTLGVQWHPVADYFTFKITQKQNHIITTKRTILSDVASLYDPLGWLAPVVITAKALMQTLWITGCSWDTSVSETIETQWKDFKNALEELSLLRIPRWIHYSEGSQIQLHGFCDASAKAYAAVLYLRVRKDDGSIVCNLLTAKTRVAPIKPTTIPRLELNGAVVLANLIKTTVQDMQLEGVPVLAWTDSMIVLQWIKEHPSRWKTYVANRVVEIQDIIRYDSWQHIPTEHNPADLASRGIPATKLINNTLWWHGPSWLTKDQSHWPRFKKVNEQTDLEAKKPDTLNLIAQSKDSTDNILLRYSSLTRLVRIVATLKRFIHNCKQPTQKSVGFLTSMEWRQAEMTILKLTQLETFSREYNSLLHNKPLPRDSKLLQLNPFLDHNNLIRVGGRLNNAMISYSQRHPIILPKDHHVTSLIIKKLHLETLHGGPSLVLSTSRNQYWILDARRVITSQIHKCIICTRFRNTATTQLMGNLPSARVNITKPFLKVGIDYAGPFMVKASPCRKTTVLKAYLCIFVCMATKAVHIELVSALTTEAFLAALKRFVARRGLCSDIYSDCGTNFIGGKSRLERDVKDAIKEATPEAAKYFASKSINWHFNPPASPHFGGLWEAGVKSIKYHLKRVLGNSILTFEEYATILTQVEACLNSRPLCHMYSSPDESFVLTPGHFLIGQALNAIPEPDYANDNLTVSQRWTLLQQKVRQFWNKWSKDYLNQLQNRPKWSTREKNLEVGDIVLVKNDNLPPTSWPLGIVEQVYPGADGLVRVVQVKTNTSSFQRPVSRICRLPVDKPKTSGDSPE